MTERATPRTDAFYNGPCKLPISRRHREFARHLERELADAKDEIARLNQSLKSASLIYDEAKEQRDRLAEALRDSMEFIPATLQGPMREALDFLD